MTPLPIRGVGLVLGFSLVIIGVIAVRGSTGAAWAADPRGAVAESKIPDAFRSYVKDRQLSGYGHVLQVDRVLQPTATANAVAGPRPGVRDYWRMRVRIDRYYKKPHGEPREVFVFSAIRPPTLESNAAVIVYGDRDTKGEALWGNLLGVTEDDNGQLRFQEDRSVALKSRH